MRDRKLFVPIIHAPIGCSKKVHHIGALVTGVYQTFADFGLGDLSDSEKEQVSDSTLLAFFFKQYAKTLWLVKKSRHKPAGEYTFKDHENTMIAAIHDGLYGYFESATDMYESRFLDDDEFYEKLCKFALHTGTAHYEIRNITHGHLQLNTMIGEQREAQKKGAHVRHTENRSMKAEVFQWLDANMATFKSMDAAATAITKQQPIVFRTAQDWTSQWKKLRPTGTP